MTRKEAAHIVDVAFGVPQAVRRIGEDRTYHEDEIREAKDMAIKALEQESYKVSEYDKDHIWYKGWQYISLRRFLEVKKALEQELCDDVISRKNTLKAMIEQLGIRNEDYLLPAEATLYKVVKNAPPVTPQPKTGHWIWNNSLFNSWTCSECGLDNDKETDYCPNCGAKMVDPQERSDEE